MEEEEMEDEKEQKMIGEEEMQENVRRVERRKMREEK